MDRSLLCELGEWAAVGYYEAAQLPWPRAYGLAYRRLYEHMEIEVGPDRLLLPSAPLPRPLVWADGKWT
ncbi:MAG: hypothetical protein IT369_14395, partial [Candidatus Latescibacteria bacterium]|nr:hypothetical protein [Candidatus Latescibacterota bacterium]